MPVNQPHKRPPSSAQHAQLNSSSKTIFRISAPSASVPKACGAIRYLGEKFAANPVNGNVSINVCPLPRTPVTQASGRSFRSPTNSGSSDGTFGFGWIPSKPSRTRKTEEVIFNCQDDQYQAADRRIYGDPLFRSQAKLISFLVYRWIDHTSWKSRKMG